MRESTVPRKKRQATIAVLAAVAAVVALAGAAGGYLLLRTKGSPQQTAASYLLDWQRGSYRAMRKVSVNVPRSGLAGPLGRAATALGIRRTHLVPGPVSVQGGTAQARFTATDELASGHTWTYQGRLQLLKRDRQWRVDWSPAAIYPGLRTGE